MTREEVVRRSEEVVWICGPVQRGKAPSGTSIKAVAADAVAEHLQLLTVTEPWSA